MIIFLLTIHIHVRQRPYIMGYIHVWYSQSEKTCKHSAIHACNLKQDSYGKNYITIFISHPAWEAVHRFKDKELVGMNG